MRRVYRTFISELVGDRAALIVRGHTDPILDTWPDADEAISAFGGIERTLFDSAHLMHLRDHPAAYEATLRAFLEKATTQKNNQLKKNHSHFGGGILKI
jgi:hypothetical protein